MQAWSSRRGVRRWQYIRQQVSNSARIGPVLTIAPLEEVIKEVRTIRVAYPFDMRLKAADHICILREGASVGAYSMNDGNNLNASARSCDPLFVRADWLTVDTKVRVRNDITCA